VATTNRIAFATYCFSTSFSENLDDSNYLRWHPQVGPILNHFEFTIHCFSYNSSTISLESRPWCWSYESPIWCLGSL